MAKIGLGFLSKFGKVIPGKDVCALDVGYSTIKVVVAGVGRGGARVKKMITHPTGLNPSIPPEDVFNQVAGELKALWKAEKLGKIPIVSVIPGKFVFVRQLKMPYVASDRLDRIVRYEAKQQIPFPLEQMRIAYHVFPPSAKGELDVTLVAVKRDVVEEHVALLRSAQMMPETIDVTSLGLFNFLVDMPAEPGVVTACVNIGALTTDIVIESGGILKFMRSAPVGGNTLTAALERDLGLPFPEAEGVKIERGRVADHSGRSDEFERNVSHILESTLERSVVNEVRKSIDFFISQPEGLTVNRVVITGGSANLPGIETFLEDRLGLPVEKMRPEKMKTLDLTGVAPIPDGAGYSVGLGLIRRLAAPDSLQLNFTPDWIEHKKQFRDRRWALCIQGLLLLILAGLSVFRASLEAGRVSLGAEYVENVVKATGKIEEDLKRTLRVRTRLDEQFSLLNQIQSWRGKYQKTLVSIVEAMPRVSVWLDSVATQGNEGLVIEGQSHGTEGLYEFLEVLNRSIRLVGVEMGPDSTSSEAGKFKINIEKIMTLEPDLDNFLSKIEAMEPRNITFMTAKGIFRVGFYRGVDLSEKIPDLIEVVLDGLAVFEDLKGIQRFQVVKYDELNGSPLDAWDFDKKTASDILTSNPSWSEYADKNRINPDTIIEKPKPPVVKQPAGAKPPAVPPKKPASPAAGGAKSKTGVLMD